MNPLSPAQFEWLGILAVAGIVVGWGARDVYLLRRYAKVGGTGDQWFGSIMGVLMALVGLGGLILHFLAR